MAIDMMAQTLDEKPIISWQVWFRTMQGLHKTLDAALVAAAAEDLPPMMIKAVPVALTDDWYETKD